MVPLTSGPLHILFQSFRTLLRTEHLCIPSKVIHWNSEPEKGALTRPKSVSTLILEFPLSRTKRNKCYLSHLCAQSLSCVQLSVTPRTVACQAPLSIGFPRQDYWSGLLFPSPGGLPDPGMKPMSPAWQADSIPVGPLKPPSLWYLLQQPKLTKTHSIFFA